MIFFDAIFMLPFSRKLISRIRDKNATVRFFQRRRTYLFPGSCANQIRCLQSQQRTVDFGRVERKLVPARAIDCDMASCSGKQVPHFFSATFSSGCGSGFHLSDQGSSTRSRIGCGNSSIMSCQLATSLAPCRIRTCGPKLLGDVILPGTAKLRGCLRGQVAR